MSDNLIIANFNIMSDNHSNWFFWDQKDEKINYPNELKERYQEILNIIKDVNKINKIDIISFQEVTQTSIVFLKSNFQDEYFIIVNDVWSPSYKPIEQQQPTKLVTMFRKNKFQNGDIYSLTEEYQKFYNKKGFNTKKNVYYPARAQIFEIKSLDFIFVNVHAPGDPNGPTQKNYYNTLTSYIRCHCNTDQGKLCNDTMIKSNKRIVFIGDFNTSNYQKIGEWSNLNNYNLEFIVYVDPENRMTSYHSGIKENNQWINDPNPYQKVDHIMTNQNININNLDVYNSNNGVITKTVDITNKQVPYLKDDNWTPNHLVRNNGWPSDHTFNVYKIKFESDNQESINNKYVRYKIIY